MKKILILALLPVLFLSAFAQTNYYKISPSDIGTLHVGIQTIPENPSPGEVVKFKIDFINPKTERIQEHIDYTFSLQRNGEEYVFGPTPLIHTSEGSVTIPVEIVESGTYLGKIEFEGILFQPIPKEIMSFTIPIASGQTDGNDTQPENGGCLIATATYGSELSPQVQHLREVRDNIVMNTESGYAFMIAFNQFYYSFSPLIADWERENLAFKETVKIILTPLLTSLSILNHVEIDSEEDMLGYGIGIILLNIGMYFAVPTLVISRWYKLRTK